MEQLVARLIFARSEDAMPVLVAVAASALHLALPFGFGIVAAGEPYRDLFECLHSGTAMAVFVWSVLSVLSFAAIVFTALLGSFKLTIAWPFVRPILWTLPLSAFWGVALMLKDMRAPAFEMTVRPAFVNQQWIATAADYLWLLPLSIVVVSWLITVERRRRV